MMTVFGNVFNAAYDKDRARGAKLDEAVREVMLTWVGPDDIIDMFYDPSAGPALRSEIRAEFARL